ncbi:MAG TPA: hypothetical protein VLH08_14895 [Acidobacteriota bacterium]|nr:hypothetical protein [Acidobacteriota bacterium]
MLKRQFPLFILVFAISAVTFAASPKTALRDRCLFAIDNSGVAADRKTLKESVIEIPGGGKYMFEFKQPDGGSFFCDICDDANPAVECGTIGLRLVHRPKDGEAHDLPAELDKKCSYFLQKELSEDKSAMKVNHELVKRIVIQPQHTDSRWVYKMSLDSQEYQCVIRKSDGSFRVEEKRGDEWRPLANGVLF